MSKTTTTELSEEPTVRAPGKKEALQAIATVLGLAGVLLTGIQYWAADRYFAQFYVTVEEVGLDTGVLLTRVATALVFIGALFVPSLLFWPGVIATGVREGSTRSRLARFVTEKFRNHPWLTTLLLSALTGAGWAIAAIAAGPATALSEGIWAYVWIGGTLLAAPSLHLVNKHRSLGSFLRLVLAVLLASGIGLIGLGDLMERYGDRTAVSGRQNALPSLLGIRLHYVHADFTEATGATAPPDGPMLYLGQSNGTYILYDCTASEVVRTSAVQVQLSSRIGRAEELLARSVERACARGANR
ncbi:hypothetical protein ACFUT3_14705 [Streptomyces cinereoruber]|uniref:hypothetical protein n=1 Tax=Streptomyces cinereoruber TaxID=67260 RepID=UPI00363CAC69